MALCTMGLFILTFITAQTSIAVVSGGLVVLGLGFGFFSSTNTSAIMRSVEKRFYGVASAMVSTMRLLGRKLPDEMDILAGFLFQMLILLFNNVYLF